VALLGVASGVIGATKAKQFAVNSLAFVAEETQILAATRSKFGLNLVGQGA
jgi:hypothetical protein